ncbi:MAG: antibiotic biosynthesis monooxygenase [Nitrospira sp.]|nr:antibiotic biosynthesis monooxygenase [Nitrospira sp.]MDH4252731.1 antibiotic biosynthesis monooxygenase [Nitrospira sp.]MDH4344565.1 antibiotic biosynthesis monooxygenase [Nitrospira sp.]MDH5338069.1 antibiotic biosynthesis monooxygenase [Nitrospira sp.]
MSVDRSLCVIARAKAKTDQVAQVREILTALVDATRREPGCLSYELLQNHDDPTDFAFVERWASPAAEQAHFATQHISVALQQVVGLLAADPEICRYRTLK